MPIKKKKYLVVADTKEGSSFGINVFSNKGDAQKQVRMAKKDKSFKKLGYKNPRIKLNK